METLARHVKALLAVYSGPKPQNDYSLFLTAYFNPTISLLEQRPFSQEQRESDH